MIQCQVRNEEAWHGLRRAEHPLVGQSVVEVPGLIQFSGGEISTLPVEKKNSRGSTGLR